MGEIAEMMLDGTMDPETGEWNFDGADGPGWPMTAAEAADYKRATGRGRQGGQRRETTEAPVYRCTKKIRKAIEAFGELRHNDAFHWQVVGHRKIIADWWPHKRKWRLAGKTETGDERAFIAALKTSAGTQP